MLVNENILRDNLREAIADVTDRSKRATLAVEKQLKEMALHMFNITGGNMAYILNGRTPVDTMSDEIMFKVASILYEYIKNNPSDFDIQKIDIEKYFTDSEKEIYNKKIDRKLVDKDIVSEYWIPIAEDEVVIRLSNKQILELASSNRIHYNPETQRDLTIVETDEGVFKKVTVDGNAVSDIKEDMINGDYIPNAITFNINPDISDQPKIVNGKFVISKECIIDCINGFHRLKASILTTKLHPEVEFNFIVIITGFDVKKAKRYIIQENYRVPLSEEQATQDDQDNPANFIIYKLKQSIYLKDSNIDNISFSLNKIITRIFDPTRLKNAEARKNALNLFRLIESNMNELIENNDWIGKEISKEEWFIYLYLIDYCNNNNKNFNTIVSKIDVDNLLGQITVTKEPTKKHFKIMGEVINNV